MIVARIYVYIQWGQPATMSEAIITTTKLEYNQDNNSNNKVKQNISTERRTLTIVWFHFSFGFGSVCSSFGYTLITINEYQLDVI